MPLAFAWVGASHAPAPEPAPASPAAWRGTSPLLDLDDPRLRLRAQSLTQLCAGERGKALAVYRFVKRIPFAKPFKMRLHTAREVMDQGRGDAADKATLAVALLRLAGLPARMRFLTLDPSILRGLLHRRVAPTRPVIEVHCGGRWVATDSYLYDAEYAAAARARLRVLGWEVGFGLHLRGQVLWDGRGDAYVNGRPPENDPLVLHDHGVFCDPLEFVSSRSYRDRHDRLARALQWNLLAPRMERGIDDLRRAARRI